MMMRSRSTFDWRASALLVSAVVSGGMLAGCSSDDDDSNPGDDLPAIGIPDAAESAGFTGGVVTAANPIAAQAGADALAAEGNAVDAAVVTQFVLNVVEPTSSGIGGGGFMGIYKPADGGAIFIDSRERAPAAATPTQFLTCDPDCAGIEEPEVLSGGFTGIATSGIGVGVPGTLLGAAKALEEHGTLSLAEALAPAIALARDGFEVNDRLAMLVATPEENNRTSFWPETAAIFRPGGTPITAGSMLVQADLARTLQLIADEGVDVFYSGEIAEAIVAAQTRTRDVVGDGGAGRMTMEDLAAYRTAGVDVRQPISSDYRGYTINGMPFPSSGGLTVAQILECIEPFDIGNADAGFGPNAANTLNVMVESMRLAFSSRSVWMGDNDADTLNLPVDGLLADGYLAPRCARIMADARIDDESVVPGDPRPFDPDFGGNAANVSNGAEGEVGIDTTHFTVIDKNGMVVSWTSTIEGTWGSGMTVPGYGFLLNNELTDFNFRPQQNDDMDDFKPGANDVAPGKRPRSSMAPTMVFAGDRFVAAYGSPGGSTIINSVVNTTINLIDHGMSVQEAIDAPRISANSPTGSISWEADIDEAARTALTALGHSFRDEPSVIGSVQAVVVNPATGLQYGGADGRRAGAVRGLPVAQ